MVVRLIVSASLVSLHLSMFAPQPAQAQQREPQRGQTEQAPSPSPLYDELLTTLDKTRRLDSLDNIQITSSSVLYLSAILHYWNPLYDQETIATAILKDLNKTRSVNTLVRIALATLDASYPVRATETGRLIGPIINALNPRAGNVLSTQLGLPTTFDDDLHDRGISLDQIANIMLKDGLTHGRAAPPIQPPTVGGRNRVPRVPPALGAAFLETLLTGEGSPYYGKSSTLSKVRADGRAAAEDRVSPFSMITREGVERCAACIARNYSAAAAIFKIGADLARVSGRGEFLLAGAVGSYVLTKGGRERCAAECGYPAERTSRASAPPIAFLENGFRDEEELAKGDAKKARERREVAAVEAEEARKRNDEKGTQEAEQRRTAAEKERRDAESDADMYRRIKDQLTSSSKTANARTDPNFDGPLPPNVGPYLRYNFVLVENVTAKAIVNAPVFRLPARQSPNVTSFQQRLDQFRATYGIGRDPAK